MRRSSASTRPRSAEPARSLRPRAASTTSRHTRRRFTPVAARDLMQCGVFPSDSIVAGRLTFQRGNPAIPAGTQIDGNLMVVECGPATKLGPGLSVNGFADFFDSSITALPARMTVRFGLDLIGTSITKLPKDLLVGGVIRLPQGASPELKAVAKSLSNNKSVMRRMPERPRSAKRAASSK